MIDDPEDKKPDDWVEEKRIVDSDAKKPDDWDDDDVYKYEDFGFIGFDLWQVKGGTIFDNVIITDDKSEADAFAKKWKALSEVENAKKKEEDDSKKAEEKTDDDKEDDDDDDEEDKTESEEM